MNSNLDLSSDMLLRPKILHRNYIPHNRLSRVLDIALILLAAPYILITFLVIMILIKLNSKGPVFYRQARIGMYGRKFYVYKFRTMVENADQILQDYLNNSPKLKAEWLATHKLKQDPRVTKVGAVLRKLSLDELPQLWNIWIGEMSIIGPRPIVDDEVEKYGNCFQLYIQVRPGLTGLWQVSGRNDTTYERRVELDEYYILNRSLVLDLKIIFKTILVVFNRRGAY